MSLITNSIYAVIFTSQQTQPDAAYEVTAERMLELAQDQPGFLGIESARNEEGFGITVSYWDSLESIRAWKAHVEHQAAQKAGREKWYSGYRVRVCRLEREYAFGEV